MPRLAEPSDLQSRPVSVTLGELSVAAGLASQSRRDPNALSLGNREHSLEV